MTTAAVTASMAVVMVRCSRYEHGKGPANSVTREFRHREASRGGVNMGRHV